MTEWFVEHEGERRGPISTTQMKSLAAKGMIGPDSLIWKEGMDDWQPAKMARGLFPSQPGTIVNHYAYDEIAETTHQDTSGKARISLVFGLIGLLTWFVPLLGAPITITGLVLGIKGMKSAKHQTAVVGVVLCIVGLFLTVVNGAIGAYMGATGQHPIVNKLVSITPAEMVESNSVSMSTDALLDSPLDKWISANESAKQECITRFMFAFLAESGKSWSEEEFAPREELLLNTMNGTAEEADEKGVGSETTVIDTMNYLLILIDDKLSEVNM